MDVDELGNETPRELLYSQRLHNKVMLLNPFPSDELILASRAQHIQRWKIPRSFYPFDKKGYLEWRSKLKYFHANTAGQILLEVGYSEVFINKVKDLIMKKNFPSDPDSRTLEDGLCLIFLQYQLDDFSDKMDKTKTINALRRSWAKMTERGRALALRLPLSTKSGAV